MLFNYVYVSYHNKVRFWFLAPLFHVCLHTFLHFYLFWLLKPFHWALFNSWVIFHNWSYRSVLTLFSECPLCLLVIKEFQLSLEGHSPLWASHAVPDFSLILLPSLDIKVYSTYCPCSTSSPFSLPPHRNHPALSLRSSDYPTQHSSKFQSFTDVLGPPPSLIKDWICKPAVIFFNNTLNIIPEDVNLHLVIDDPSNNLASPFLVFLPSHDLASDFPQSSTLKMLGLCHYQYLLP